MAASPGSLVDTLRQRRQRLANHITFPVVLWSGRPSVRNFPANTYPFRANSHFLYFAGVPLVQAAIYLEGNRLTLFMDEASVDEALWQGPTPTRAAIAATIGADAAYPLAALPDIAAEAITLPGSNGDTLADQLHRSNSVHPAQEHALAEAIVAVRLTHDAAAIAAIRQAIAVSIQAHQAGMQATRPGQTEAAVRAAMEAAITAQDMTCAYTSIVTVHGEILHNQVYGHSLQPGDLLLADVGAETPSGWASDITRTWPVSGHFSTPQRDLYDVVLAAHDAAIGAARPGVEYRDLHWLACHTLAAGLVDLGILKGSPESLVDHDAHALFFPHGIGHLLGLDVHDMEDLGDLAGYAPGRQRSDRFGLGFLRLDRPLQAGMVVTIEPGFYQVPAILQRAARQDHYQAMVNWDRLADFQEIRGVRIEDDVLITTTDHEVLTAALPTTAAAVEALVNS